jgi:hypothetical protein
MVAGLTIDYDGNILGTLLGISLCCFVDGELDNDNDDDTGKSDG